MKLRIQSALERHGSALLQFSGGKDSLAVLHAAKGWADRVTVLWTDAGDAFPHVTEFVFAICDLWGFPLTVVEGDAPAYTASLGLPSDIIPFWSTHEAGCIQPKPPAQRIVSPFDCCWANLWTPMERAVVASGTTLVLRGSKSTDAHVGVPDGYIENGIEYVSPAWGMTDDDVYAYLLEHGVKLPLQYGNGVNHSLDCATCTAWLDTEAERQRIAFTREHYPALFAELQGKTARLWDEIGRQVEALRPSLEELRGELDPSCKSIS